jgi:hypothetical protein
MRNDISTLRVGFHSTAHLRIKEVTMDLEIIDLDEIPLALGGLVESVIRAFLIALLVTKILSLF